MKGKVLGESIPIASSKKLLGHLTEYVSNPLDFLHNKWKLKGDLFKFRVAHRYLVVATHPDYIRHILQENHTNYKKSLAYRKLKLLLGNGLFTSEGDYWLKQRRLSQPAFHRDKITSYFDSMVFYTSEFMQSLKQLAEGREPVAFHKEMTELTLKIICKTLLNIDLNHGGKVVEENLSFALVFMMKRVTSSINLPMMVPTTEHQRFKVSVTKIRELIDEIIEKKRKTSQPSNDLLSMLMEVKDEDTGEKMSNTQLKDEILTFFLAGHETSAVALTWAMYLIHTHPETLNKVKREVNEVIGNQELEMGHLRKLTFTTQVIKETMRLISPVWVLGREAIEEDNLGKYRVKKGASIIFSPYLVHRHPDFWEDPDKFDPERFSFLNEPKIHKFAYFPFGGGPRLCIGSSFAMMEMQVILALLIKNFDFKINDDKHPGFNFSLTLRPAEEINMSVHCKSSDFVNQKA